MSSPLFLASAMLHPGIATGPILKLAEPLSFWGGFDPKDGKILDRAHPQVGQSITGSVLVMPGSRGSAGTPAGIAEAIRRNVGPAAIFLLKPDVNITIGAQVAERLYGVSPPVLTIEPRSFNMLETGKIVSINNNRIEEIIET